MRMAIRAAAVIGRCEAMLYSSAASIFTAAPVSSSGSTGDICFSMSYARSGQQHCFITVRTRRGRIRRPLSTARRGVAYTETITIGCER